MSHEILNLALKILKNYEIFIFENSKISKIVKKINKIIFPKFYNIFFYLQFFCKISNFFYNNFFLMSKVTFFSVN